MMCSILLKLLLYSCENGDLLFRKAAAGGFYVEMMGLIGMGNNPMVGATVAVAVAVEEAMKNA